MLEYLLPLLITFSGGIPVHFHTSNNEIDRVELQTYIESVFELVDEPVNECFVELLLGTAAVESTMGKNKGNQKYDFGVFQINYATERDFLKRVVKKYPKYEKYINYYQRKYGSRQCRGIIEYQILLTILIYKERIPLLFANDVQTKAIIWKKHYNTYKGNGKIEHFISKYKVYVEEGV